MMITKELKTNENNFETMNAVIKFKDMPKELQQYIRVVLYNNTDCYKWEGKPDWDKLENSLIGFQIYKDYYNYISVYYVSQDGFYSSVGFGKLYNKNELLDLTAYVNCIYSIDTVTEQLSNILTDRQVIHDYDREQLMEAIEAGDFETAEDICGDRDIFELI